VLGRQDIVVDQQWETALHHAAGEGKLEMARLLLDLGANPALRDRRFKGTPRDWAVHLGHQDLVELFDTRSSTPSRGGTESVR
jgi:ankyrin repeat protein